MTLRLLITAIVLLLAGCEIPGMGPDPKIAQREANAKAIGGACRHGLRSIEDCYSLNESASKADMFTGWKDMDQYMRENKIEGVRATVVKAEPAEDVVEAPKLKAGSKDKALADAKEDPSETKPKSTARTAVKSTTKPTEKAAAH